MICKDKILLPVRVRASAARTHLQRGVDRVDDSVYLHLRDVLPDDGKGRGTACFSLFWVRLFNSICN